MDAVSAGTVPGHPDEEGAVVAVVGGPPGLRIGHQVGEVLLEGCEVEFLEFLGIVEIHLFRADEFGVLTQNSKVELVGPPVAVGSTGTGSCDQFSVEVGTLAGRFVDIPYFTVRIATVVAAFSVIRHIILVLIAKMLDFGRVFCDFGRK